MKGNIKKRVVISVICFILFLVLSINLSTLKEHEEPLFRVINRDCSNLILDSFFVIITDFGRFKYILIGCIVAFCCLSSIEQKRTIVLIFIGLVLSSVTTIYLKNYYKEERPFEVLDYTILVSDSSQLSYSYPSGHTANVFVYATIIAIRHPKMKFTCLLVASLVALSRVYLGVHWGTDVIGGALLGICVGIFVTILGTIIKNDNNG